MTEKTITLNFKSPKLCLVITPADQTELPRWVDIIDTNQPDLVEWRADYWQGLQPDDIGAIVEQIPCPVLFTLRHTSEGGQWGRTQPERLPYYLSALNSAVWGIDIELACQDIEISESITPHLKNSELILSTHSFDRVMSREEIAQSLDKAFDHGATIAKIATKVQTLADTLPLLEATKHNQTMSRRTIAIGMGEVGQITRILGPMLGGELTYAISASDYSTASGQLNIKHLQQLIELLSSKL